MRWESFAKAEPEMAETGRKLIYQFGPGLAFLATVRADGGPRMHPFCPVIAEGGLYGFIIPSPKQADLLRDGRYAIHSFPPEHVDDEFYVTGIARKIDDERVRKAVLESYLATGATSTGDETLFEFDLEHAMLATYKQRPDWPPTYRKWAAPHR